MRLVLALAAVLASFGAAAASCPPSVICVPRSVLSKMSPQELEGAKQLARNYGVQYKIVDDNPRKRILKGGGP